MQVIDVLRVPVMGSPDSLGESLFGMRRDNQVNVVRHQAVAENLKAVSRRLLTQKRKIPHPVLLREEDRLTIVAPLRHMVRSPRHDCPSDTRHGGRIIRQRMDVKRKAA